MRQGGSYTKDKNGKSVLIERTENHKKGNRARDAKGKVISVKPGKTNNTKTVEPKKGGES